MTDLYKFSMTGDRKQQVDAALSFACLGIGKNHKRAEGWGITNAGILVIFSSTIDATRECIVESGRVVGGEQALSDFILSWLKEAKYPEQPDIDGSCSKGFKITNEWSDSYVVNDKPYSCRPQWLFWDLYTFVAPEWIEYHK